LLSEKSIVITGSGSGVGRASALTGILLPIDGGYVAR